MKDFFRHNGILILIAAILLALVTAVVSMLFGGVADPLSNLVGILTTPVRNGITAVTNWAEEKYNDAFELEQMKEELAGLKQRNAELEAQAREAEAALQENERLRNLLELQPKEWSCDKAAAMVTARSTSNWESTLTLSKGSLPDLTSLSGLVLLGLARSLLAAGVLWGIRRSRRLLLVEEHERRYQRLFLMTANLKNELYFLKKDAENIEGIMTRAYRLYEQLGEQSCPEELRQLALSIARDVHEVKKDNLSIIRGIEGEVAGTGTDNDEQMWISDLFHILQDTMGHILGEEREKIAIQCHYETDFATEEHYRLMSILKNLVMNAAEAIQSGRGTGAIWVEEHLVGEDLVFTVQDNGPGISPRAMQNLFRVGYSTKFNPETGNISRGIGLPAVEFMVQELGGTIQVDSGPGTVPGGTDATGACFRVTIPRTAMEKGAV